MRSAAPPTGHAVAPSLRPSARPAGRSVGGRGDRRHDGLIEAGQDDRRRVTAVPEPSPPPVLQPLPAAPTPTAPVRPTASPTTAPVPPPRHRRPQPPVRALPPPRRVRPPPHRPQEPPLPPPGLPGPGVGAGRPRRPAPPWPAPEPPRAPPTRRPGSALGAVIDTSRNGNGAPPRPVVRPRGPGAGTAPDDADRPGPDRRVSVGEAARGVLRLPGRTVRLLPGVRARAGHRLSLVRLSAPRSGPASRRTPTSPRPAAVPGS